MGGAGGPQETEGEKDGWEERGEEVGGANALRWDPPQDPSSPTFSGETEICIALGLSGFVETSEEVGGFVWVNLDEAGEQEMEAEGT